MWIGMLRPLEIWKLVTIYESYDVRKRNTQGKEPIGLDPPDSPNLVIDTNYISTSVRS